MAEAPENGKELSHSAHANGMNGVNRFLYTIISYFNVMCLVN
jgi:hypothetical protein